jgi:beta-lactamase superfamily II metal-dependent hydrolase
MFRIEMLPAEYGDCLWIEYGQTDNEVHRVLFDGGTNACGKVLQKRIKSLPKKERHFDLVVVTHIDSDHIDGMVELIQDIPDGFGFGHFWFNAYEHTRPEGFLGAIQGEYLAVELLALEKKWERAFWNESFGRKAAMLPDKGDPVQIELEGGMWMTVLGPTSAGLRKLRKEWEEVMEEAHIKPGDTEAVLKKLREDRRFRPGWLGKLDIGKLADSDFEEDKSPANGSSIILLAEYENKKVLFAGDAFPGNIIAGLERLPGHDGRRTSLDAFKVPHHGSKNNNSNDLFRALDCPRFLVSTNGDKFGHPDDEGIARILHNKRKSREAFLYFNYASEMNSVWADKEMQADYVYVAVYPEGDRCVVDLIR